MNENYNPSINENRLINQYSTVMFNMDAMAIDTTWSYLMNHRIKYWPTRIERAGYQAPIVFSE